jgi:phosphate/sulfate permease
MLLAAVDLTVGVANDAVNFLNSAIGSKAAKFRTIMIVAAAGVLVGVSFSSGMMEVARKGIFNPDMFFMAELLVIFLAVMFQDILLLDIFNTLGLPTSTTVSIVFGLFGSSLAIAVIKSLEANQTFFDAFAYINSANLIAIVSAILLSIVFAFVFGALIQYLSRLLFTFNYNKTFRKFGAVWSALALTSISIFIIIKGAKGATYIPDDTANWMKDNLILLSLYIFIGYSIILQLILSFTKLNVLKFVVLAGTFSLAMAFAANDLVNFIGAPLAGLKAYQIAHAAGDPMASMAEMTQKFPANTMLLILAGLIMVTTLFLSKKARNVAMTTIDLSSQNSGQEKFESNMVARELVRGVINIIRVIVDITPKNVRTWVRNRFNLSQYNPKPDDEGDLPAFDLVRAAVILMVAAALISFATTLKLPLSTTYVTFIVAMAAALPDKAWGRETAVYRVSGVVTVVAGWFVTAIAASIVAGVIALLLYYLEIYAIFGLLILVGLVIYRTHIASNKKHKTQQELKAKAKIEKLTNKNPVLGILFEIGEFISNANKIINNSYDGLIRSDLNQLRSAKYDAKSNTMYSQMLVNNVLKRLKDTPDEDVETEFAYTQALGTFQDINDKLEYLSKQNYSYINNNHDEFTNDQAKEIDDVLKKLILVFDESKNILQNREFDKLEYLENESKELKKLLKRINKNQLIRIKESSSNLKRSRLFLTIITDMESMRNNVVKLTEVGKNLLEQAKKYDPNL